MTVSELIQRLEDQDPEAEVRFNYQESYPLQSSLRGIWTCEAETESDECDECGVERGWHGEEDHKFSGKPSANAGIVYLVEGSQDYATPYGHRAAFENAY